jgi:hypothetical protein
MPDDTANQIRILGDETYQLSKLSARNLSLFLIMSSFLMPVRRDCLATTRGFEGTERYHHLEMPRHVRTRLSGHTATESLTFSVLSSQIFRFRASDRI